MDVKHKKNNECVEIDITSCLVYLLVGSDRLYSVFHQCLVPLECLDLFTRCRVFVDWMLGYYTGRIIQTTAMKF